MIDAEMIKRIRAQVSFRVVLPVPKRNPPLINAHGLKGAENSGIYDDAGMLSGEVNPLLYGSCANKSGIVNKELWGNWTEVTGIIDPDLIGLCTGISGKADGKRGNISGVYGPGFGGWRGIMTGLSGYLYPEIGGDATGITATTDEIREALKGDGNQVP